MPHTPHMLAVRLPEDLSTRLKRLAESTSRSKSFHVRTLLAEHLSELEYVAGIDARAEAIRRGEVATRPMDDLIAELGVDRDELIAEGHRELGI